MWAHPESKSASRAYGLLADRRLEQRGNPTHTASPITKRLFPDLPISTGYFLRDGAIRWQTSNQPSHPGVFLFRQPESFRLTNLQVSMVFALVVASWFAHSIPRSA